MGDSRTFWEEQWLRLGKGAAVVMRKICVALRVGARREAPSRLRARLEDRVHLRKWLPLSKSALRTEVSLTGSADSLPSGKTSVLCRLDITYGVMVCEIANLPVSPPHECLYYSEYN